MDISRLKEHILENDKIPTILEELGCHHIKNKGEYYTCGNPDGDNPSAITVYANDYLTCINYTRDIGQDKSGTDIFSLIEFHKKYSFFEAIKQVCDWVDLDYYYDFDADVPESIKLTRLIMEMQQGDNINKQEKPLRPISETILTYYCPYINDLFNDDGIDYQTQKLFEIGYDEFSNRITIPIRDELRNLVGIKGRLLQKEIRDNELKYLYLEPCARSKILYGLHLTYEYIKREKRCFIGESEKSVLQMWTMGYCNAVGTGGKEVTTAQIDKLTRLCVDLVFLFDKDVPKSDIESLSKRFIDGINIYAVIDNKEILSEKESPTDNIDKFNRLLNECLYKIK